MTPLQLQGIGMTSQRTRDRLIDRLKKQGICRPDVLEVMANTPRHLFVDEALSHRAYEDTALPIGFGQTISQPYIVAKMTEILLNTGSVDNVLEIGTGCGYQTLVLSQLMNRIYSVERIEGLQKKAKQRMALLRSHGVTRDEADMIGESDGPWYYQQVSLGFNYRMTELQAALGLSQLTRLSQFVVNRNRLAERYDVLLSELPVERPIVDKSCYSAFHLYIVRLQLCSVSRRQVFDAMRSQGIGVHVHYIPVHTQPYYQALGFASGDFPAAESYYECALSLPLYQQMTEPEQDSVVAALREALLI